MQTPKARNSPSEVTQKISPRAVSSETPQKTYARAVSLGVPQKTSPRAVPSEASQKISPRVVRRLKTTGLESESASSSNQASRTLKNTSPKVIERRSPKSPVTELQKKRPSRASELESQISQLQDDLKRVKDQLSASESWKNQAPRGVEESKKNLLVVSSELEESQQLVDPASLASATSEIEQLKAQLELVAESEVTQTKQAESANAELHNLKDNLAETLLVLEGMKNQLSECKQSEAQAQALVGETLLQLETAKMTVESLRLDGMKTMEAYDAVTSELDRSRAQVNSLEGLVNKLQGDQGLKIKCETKEDESFGKSIEAEVISLKSEVGRLISDLEAAEMRYLEEQIRSTVQIKSAYELVEEIKSTSSLRENEWENELKEAKAHIEELKANLMDKETELQGICEENEGLNMRLEKTESGQRENELEKELNKTKKNIENFKANMVDKETELQNILEENELLKLETKRKEVNDEGVNQLEAARAAEREALVKLGYAMEEAEKNNRRVTRVAEQLEAAQAANSEMEADLRRLKVQSDQWRKAAEAAAAMISSGNNGKFVERTASLDSNYSHMDGKISSPYSEDMDDDFLKKKNGNMLKRIGVLWKKPQK